MTHTPLRAPGLCPQDAFDGRRSHPQSRLRPLQTAANPGCHPHHSDGRFLIILETPPANPRGRRWPLQSGNLENVQAFFSSSALSFPNRSLYICKAYSWRSISRGKKISGLLFKVNRYDLGIKKSIPAIFIENVKIKFQLFNTVNIIIQ